MIPDLSGSRGTANQSDEAQRTLELQVSVDRWTGGDDSLVAVTPDRLDSVRGARRGRWEAVVRPSISRPPSAVPLCPLALAARSVCQRRDHAGKLKDQCGSHDRLSFNLSRETPREGARESPVTVSGRINPSATLGDAPWVPREQTKEPLSQIAYVMKKSSLLRRSLHTLSSGLTRLALCPGAFLGRGAPPHLYQKRKDFRLVRGFSVSHHRRYVTPLCARPKSGSRSTYPSLPQLGNVVTVASQLSLLCCMV